MTPTELQHLIKMKSSTFHIVTVSKNVFLNKTLLNSSLTSWRYCFFSYCSLRSSGASLLLTLVWRPEISEGMNVLSKYLRSMLESSTSIAVFLVSTVFLFYCFFKEIVIVNVIKWTWILLTYKNKKRKVSIHEVRKSVLNKQSKSENKNLKKTKYDRKGSIWNETIQKKLWYLGKICKMNGQLTPLKHANAWINSRPNLRGSFSKATILHFRGMSGLSQAATIWGRNLHLQWRKKKKKTLTPHLRTGTHLHIWEEHLQL